MSLYWAPRATRDFDFVIHLTSCNVGFFIEKFQEGYYYDRDQINEALNHPDYGMFNITDHSSGYKADFVVLKNILFRQEEFSRRLAMDFYARTIYVVTPEDLLLSKLIWVQDYQSTIQMEDIRNLAQIADLDKNYISRWVKSLHLVTFNLLNDEGHS